MLYLCACKADIFELANKSLLKSLFACNIILFNLHVLFKNMYFFAHNLNVYYELFNNKASGHS